MGYRILYVPRGTKESYQTMSQWNEFHIVEGLSITYINPSPGVYTNLTDEQVKILIRNNEDNSLSGFKLKLELKTNDDTFFSEITTETFTGIIPAMNESEYTFEAALNLLTIGRYDIKVTIISDENEELYNGTITVIIPECTPVDSGVTGNLCWWLCPDGTLTISGNGDMPNYEWIDWRYTSAPWDHKKELITVVVIEDGVASIGDYAFFDFYCKYYDNENTIRIIFTIPATVTSIGEMAFVDWSEGQRGLAEIINHATTPQPVCSSALENANKFILRVPAESVDAYKAAEFWEDFMMIIAIGDESGICSDPQPFEDNDNLSWSLCLDGTLTISGTGEIDDAWFSFNEFITAVVIERGITRIGYNVFTYYENLTSVTIPESISIIEEFVFNYCNRLISITVDTNNPNYSSEDGVLFNKDKTILIWYPAGKENANYDIPASVITIEDNAFGDCNYLTSITIPESVTSIGYVGFLSCNNLTSITVNDNNALYASVDGVLFDKDKTTIIQYPAGKENTNYIIPALVTTIGSNAFGGSNKLISVIIPETATTIGAYAFGNCINLSSVFSFAKIPPDLDGWGVFWGLPANKTLYVPAGTKETYQEMSQWDQFNIIESKHVISNAMPNLINLTENAQVKVFIANYDELPFTGFMLKLELNANDGAGFTHIATETYPGSIASMDVAEYIFTATLNLMAGGEFDIKVTIISNNDEELLSDTVTVFVAQLCASILANGKAGDHIWWWLCHDGRLTISGNGEMSDYDMPWEYRDLVTSVVIEHGITSIADWAFANHENLTSVSIPESVTTIGYFTFSYCGNLYKITNHAAIPQPINNYVFYYIDKSFVTLYVPEGSEEAYRNAEVWREFYKIEAIGVNQSVTGISLNKSALILEVGDSEQLAATIQPSDATNKKIYYARL